MKDYFAIAKLDNIMSHSVLPMGKLIKKTTTKIKSTDDQMHISRDFCPHLPLQSFYILSPCSSKSSIWNGC